MTEAGNINPWRLIVLVAIVISVGIIYEATTLEATNKPTFQTTDETHKFFNLVEGLIWVGVGIVLLWNSRSFERVRSPTVLAGVAFILFGVSDFIEIRTGSWFEPVWLLIWNGACVVSLVSCLVWYLALRRKQE